VTILFKNSKKKFRSLKNLKKKREFKERKKRDVYKNRTIKNPNIKERR